MPFPPATPERTCDGGQELPVVFLPICGKQACLPQVGVISMAYVNAKKIKMGQIFKDDKDKIHELKLDAIKTNIKEILKETNELVKKYYETPAKIIIVLQKLEKTIWNISYITETFNLINIKIDASTGKKISENRSSLLSFKAD